MATTHHIANLADHIEMQVSYAKMLENCSRLENISPKLFSNRKIHHTIFVQDGLGGKKNARQNRGCHENALIESFAKSST